jgi:hypothetical protein
LSSFSAVITFKSAVHAIMGEEAIAAAGLRVGVMGRPVELGADCGFCLRVGREDLERALLVLKSAGLSWQGAYQDEPGRAPRFSRLDGEETEGLSGARSQESPDLDGGPGADGGLSAERSRGSERGPGSDTAISGQSRGQAMKERG